MNRMMKLYKEDGSESIILCRNDASIEEVQDLKPNNIAEFIERNIKIDQIGCTDTTDDNRCLEDTFLTFFISIMIGDDLMEKEVSFFAVDASIEVGSDLSDCYNECKEYKRDILHNRSYKLV